MHEIRENGSPTRWEGRALGAGFLFAALQLAALGFSFLVVVPTHAPVDAPPSETAAALADHATLIAVGTYLFVLPMPFFLFFLGGAFGTLRRTETGDAVLAVAALAAGGVVAVVPPLGAVLSGLAAETARLGGDPVVVKQLDAITPLAMALAGPAHAVFILASLAALGGRRRLPSMTWWTGLVVAALGAVASLTIAVNELFPLVVLEMTLFPLWLVAMVVALRLRHARQRESAGDAAALAA